MTDYESYTFILCLIVYVLLTTLSVMCISIIMKMTLRIIRSGLDDPRIIDEYDRNLGKEKLNKFARILNFVFSFAVCLAFLVVFISSFFVADSSGTLVFQKESAYRVVQTGSMEKKNEKNKYLFANDLNDQIKTFDVIRTEALPDEMELELYDIVVYEVDGIQIVHRIVGIEEPNQYHPDCRHFKLQGDAIDSPDRFPVLYGQMKALYTGTRVPFVGSFILFMQSPAGWLCVLLIIIAMIATPILEHKIKKEQDIRLALYDRIPGGPFPSGGILG